MESDFHVTFGLAAAAGALSSYGEKPLVNTPRTANVKFSPKGGFAQRRFEIMLVSLFITGVLGGIAALVLVEAINEGRGCSGKLHDRYHE